MNVSTVKKSATKGFVIFAFAAAGFFILASLAKRFPIARTVQDKIGQGI